MLKIISVDNAADPYRAPDIGWDGQVGDLLLNALTHPDAPGDFRAEQGLATQVLICLMTDARVDDSEMRDGDENRGWVGDSFDRMAGETPIGSKLWLPAE
jgi:phage gp46-like protein